MPKMVKLASFSKAEACGQTALTDRSLLIEQKLVENAKIRKNLKCDFLSDFETLSLLGHLSIVVMSKPKNRKNQHLDKYLEIG